VDNAADQSTNQLIDEPRIAKNTETRAKEEKRKKEKDFGLVLATALV